MGRNLAGRALLATVAIGISALLSVGAAPLAAAQHPAAQRHAPGRRPAPGRAAERSDPAPSVLDLQRALAELGYLPVAWGPDGFTYPEHSVPTALASLFVPGKETALLTGALMTFEADHGLPLSSSASPAVWQTLQEDLAAGKVAPSPYGFAYVDRSLPQRIYIWTASGDVTVTPANTGVAGATTPDGTYPVFLKVPFQVMRGQNLDGTTYADPVSWILYFHGGDAVHGFARAAYGYPQSLGCVEVPVSAAQWIYEELQVGSLVTISPLPFSLEVPFVAPPPVRRAGLPHPPPSLR